MFSTLENEEPKRREQVLERNGKMSEQILGHGAKRVKYGKLNWNFFGRTM